MKFQPLDLDALVLAAQKPSRYVGGEVNAIAKDPRSARITWALCFPDTYEVGMSNVGFRLLYHVLNQRPDVACDRSFAPWPDMSAMMRAKGIPLWALESRAPLRDFDILGFSLQFEAAYTSCLEMLDLSGIPVFSKDRTEEHPLILAGGPCTVNGEPVAPFFDAMVIGEGEEVVLEISDAVADAKAKGLKRTQLLDRLAEIPGVYVPSLFEVRYRPDKTVEAIVPRKPGYEKVSRRVIPDLNQVPQPERPIVPFMQTIHDRLPLEIQRGCTRGCRFCQVGMLTRPTRQRDPAKVLELATKGLANSGYEEVGFLSLSAGDYECINPLLEEFFNKFSPERIAISLPSLRTETMNERLAQQIGKVKKTGFTIAPEAASDRMRKVINKGNTEENLLKAIDSVFRNGWSLIKLYFMIGLPTEMDEDVLAIAALAKKAHKVSRAIRPDAMINVSVSTFIPKPFTPFQWEPMIDTGETIRKHDLLRAAFPRRGPLALKYHEAKGSVVEGALARGDRRLATAVHAAWKQGQVLDGWTEHFNHDRWEKAFVEMEREHGVDWRFFTLRERSRDEVLPWDHIDCGVSKEFLLRERDRSRKLKTLFDCSKGFCPDCGACDFEKIQTKVYREKDYVPSAPSEPPPPTPEIPVADRGLLRVRFAKLGRAIAVSHLETIGLLMRALRRSKLPVAYSQGFSPHLQVSFGPACPTGVESKAEFFDLELVRRIDPKELMEALGPEMPPGFPLIDAQPLEWKARSLTSSMSAVHYLARFPEPRADLAQCIEKFQAAERCEVVRAKAARGAKGPRTGKVVDLKAAVLGIEVAGLSEVRFRLRAGNEASAKPTEVLSNIFGQAEGVRLMKEDVSFSAEPAPQEEPVAESA